MAATLIRIMPMPIKIVNGPFTSMIKSTPVKLSFELLDTETENDVLTIYSGEGCSGEKLGEYSGDKNPTAHRCYLFQICGRSL